MIEQLELLKQLLGIESFDISRDDILTHYLKKANSIILGYCNIDILPTIYDDIVVDYACTSTKTKISKVYPRNVKEKKALYMNQVFHRVSDLLCLCQKLRWDINYVQ